jgi:hypothetical protein
MRLAPANGGAEEAHGRHLQRISAKPTARAIQKNYAVLSQGYPGSRGRAVHFPYGSPAAGKAAIGLAKMSATRFPAQTTSILTRFPVRTTDSHRTKVCAKEISTHRQCHSDGHHSLAQLFARWQDCGAGISFPYHNDGRVLTLLFALPRRAEPEDLTLTRTFRFEGCRNFVRKQAFGHYRWQKTHFFVKRDHGPPQESPGLRPLSASPLRSSGATRSRTYWRFKRGEKRPIVPDRQNLSLNDVTPAYLAIFNRP